MNTSRISCILIDDEAAARDTLKGLLETYVPEAEIIGEAASAKEGIKLVTELRPTLIFLDIQMPGGSGFQLLESLDTFIPRVVFTTAYDQYALKAIKFSALDYLLKPIDIVELQDAVAKALEQVFEDPYREKVSTLISNQQIGEGAGRRIVLPGTDGFTVTPVDQIAWCQADRNYTWIHLQSGERLLASKTLKEFEEMLSDAGFFRIHHSHLINLEYVRQYRHGRQGQVILLDGTSLQVARSRRNAFLAHFQE